MKIKICQNVYECTSNLRFAQIQPMREAAIKQLTYDNELKSLEEQIKKIQSKFHGVHNKELDDLKKRKNILLKQAESLQQSIEKDLKRIPQNVTDKTIPIIEQENSENEESQQTEQITQFGPLYEKLSHNFELYNMVFDCSRLKISLLDCQKEELFVLNAND